MYLKKSLLGITILLLSVSLLVSVYAAEELTPLEKSIMQRQSEAQDQVNTSVTLEKKTKQFIIVENESYEWDWKVVIAGSNGERVERWALLTPCIADITYVLTSNRTRKIKAIKVVSTLPGARRAWYDPPPE